MYRNQLVRLVVVLMLLFSGMSIAFAQGTTLIYGASISGVYDGAPQTFTFDGGEGDVATLYIIGESNFQPTMALARSNGEPITFVSGDALSPMNNDARITAILPADDTYIVTVSSQSGETSPFFLTLTEAEALSTIALTGTSGVTIAPEGAPQQFSIAALPEGSQVLEIQESDPFSGFTALLQAPDGRIIASIAIGVGTTTFTLPADDGDYLLTVDAADTTLGTSVDVSLVTGDSTSTPTTTDDSSDDNDPPPPAATEEADAPASGCLITANGNVNLRGGPGTNYEVVGGLSPGDTLIPTGQNGGWYNGTLNGQSAWVSAGVVNASGDCASLPQVAAPPAPTGGTDSGTSDTTAPTATTQPTVTAASGGNTQPTSPPPPPPTSTPPPPPTATEVPFTVTSLSCRYFLNDGATVDFRVEGPPSGTFQVQVRFGSTTYTVDRTMNQQGFLSGNQRFGQAGNANYVAFIVYNGVDVASAEC